MTRPIVRFSYLVMAHRDEAQLDRLIGRLLAAPDDTVVLHLDSGSPIRTAGARLVSRPGGRLRLVERPVRVRWGHRSQVEAIRRLLRTALEQPFDMAHLLSGADWPLATRALIAAEADDRCFIEAEPGVQSDRMMRWRLDGRWQGPGAPTTNRAAAARRLTAGMGRMVDGIRRRTEPLGPWHKGSSWWSLPRDVCAVVADELEELTRSGRLRYTACPDEHAVQTIVAARWPERIAPNRRHMEWSPGAPSPAVLTRVSRPALDRSDAWFMRKVDPAIDDFFLGYPAI